MLQYTRIRCHSSCSRYRDSATAKTPALPFFSDGMSCSHLPLHHRPTFSHHILQIYNQPDGSYIGSPEMSPVYSIVNALSQTAATIILVLVPASLLVLYSPSICLSSLDQSPFPLSPFLESNSDALKTPTLSPVLCLSYNAHHSSLAGELHQMIAISIKSKSSVGACTGKTACQRECGSLIHKYASF